MTRQPPRGPSRPGPRGLKLAELLTVSDQTDASGRLLLEDSAPEAAQRRAVRAGIDMQTVTCPYVDTPSRHGGPMNRPAYEALRRDTAEVLDGFRWLSRGYLERVPGDHGTTRALAEVSKLGITLPLVLFHRGEDPIQQRGGLPPFIASIFKASRGVYSAAFDLIRALGVGARTSGAEVVRFADRHGHLRRDRVCAAPTRLIERAIDAMLTGGDDQLDSGLERYTTFELLWEFHRIEQAITQALAGYGALFQQLIARVGPSDPAALFSQRVDDDGVTRPFGEVTDTFLGGVTELQARLNRLLGRRDNAPPLSLRDVLEAM